MGASDAIDASPGATNRLAVIGLGRRFVCLVNDQLISTFSADLAPGQPGLGAQSTGEAPDSRVEFSGFEVRAP